jgi:hypothetical protein
LAIVVLKMPLEAKSIRDQYVTAVRVTGYKREEASGAWVYVILVTWSDKSRFEIYRRYADFFAFQDILLKLFPREAGKYDRHDRRIPYLPTSDNVLKLFEKYFSARRLESRLKTINYYCETILVKLDASLSRCNFVLQFFNPQPGDQQLLGLARPPSLHPQNVPASSQFEEYRVIAKFEAESSKQLSVSVGETVLVIDKNDSGWWYVARAENSKESGWVPGSFLGPPLQDVEDFIDNPEEWGDEQEGDHDHEQLYEAIADYDSGDANQLSFKEGDKVKVVDKDDDGWWFAVVNDVTGWIPSTYLEPVKTDPEESLLERSGELLKDSHQGEGGEHSVYWVIKEYTAFFDDEISLPKFGKVKVLSINSNGWWKVEFDGRTGLAPAAYLSSEHPREVGDDTVIKYHKRGAVIKRRTHRYNEPPPRTSSVRKLSKRHSQLISLEQDDTSTRMMEQQEVINGEPRQQEVPERKMGQQEVIRGETGQQEASDRKTGQQEVPIVKIGQQKVVNNELDKQEILKGQGEQSDEPSKLNSVQSENCRMPNMTRSVEEHKKRETSKEVVADKRQEVSKDKAWEVPLGKQLSVDVEEVAFGLHRSSPILSKRPSGLPQLVHSKSVQSSQVSKPRVKTSLTFTGSSLDFDDRVSEDNSQTES